MKKSHTKFTPFHPQKLKKQREREYQGKEKKKGHESAHPGCQDARYRMILERFFGAILSESVTEQELGTCAVRQRRRRRGNANRIVSGDIDMGRRFLGRVLWSTEMRLSVLDQWKSWSSSLLCRSSQVLRRSSLQSQVGLRAVNGPGGRAGMLGPDPQHMRARL